MSRIFLPVRAVCEIISRPVYYRDPQYNEVIAGVLRTCQNPCVVAGSSIIDPVCLQVLDLHRDALLEKLAEGNPTEAIVDSLFDDPDLEPEVRYDYVTAVNKLRGFFKERPIMSRFGLRPAGNLIVKEFEEGFIMRGRLDSTTKEGHPVEIKSRSKQMYVTIPRNEYIQCQLYCAITDTPCCLFIQEFRGQCRSTRVERNEAHLTEIIDNVVALSEALRQMIETDADATLDHLPEFQWGLPKFVKKMWSVV